MGKYSSAQLNKTLNKLQKDYDTLLQNESRVSTYTMSVGEKAEDVKNEYNYEDTKHALKALEEEIIGLKHKLNVFNATTIIPEFNMTIDQMLVWLPMKTREVRKLNMMRSMLPKERVKGGYLSENKNGPEYKYVNFNIQEIAKDYEDAAAELAKAQLALDNVNAQEVIEIAD